MKLTPEQAYAVSITDRDVGILAPAGSGKTTVLCAHYVHLLTEGKQSANRVLVFTFTEKATHELKERVQTALRAIEEWPHLVPQFWSSAWLSTIHHFCGELCRRHADRLQIRDDFSIIEPELSTIRYRLHLETYLKHLDDGALDILAALFNDYGLENIEAVLLEAHQKRVTPQSMMKSNMLHAVHLARLYTEIEKRFLEDKRLQGLMDFDDLELGAVSLLKEHSDLRAKYRALFSHILVDEFQDLNDLQGELIHYLWQPEKNRLFFVGDPKQSIYGFRGANVQLFYRYFERVKEVCGETVVLTENWRSSKELIAHVNAVFTPLFRDAPIPYTPMVPGQAINPSCPPFSKGDSLTLSDTSCLEKEISEVLNENREKTLRNPSILYDELTEKTAPARRDEEARAILEKIRHALQNGVLPEQIAVLSRQSTFFNYLSRYLDRAGLLYDIKKTRSLFTEPMATSLYDFVRWRLCPEDPARVFSLCHSYLLKRFELNSEDLTQFLRADEKAQPLPPLSLELERFRLFIEKKTQRDFFEEPYHSFIYFRFLKLLQDEERSHLPTSRSKEAWERFLVLLLESSPSAPKKEDRTKGAIQLMTIHAAKGLEFDWVILADLLSGQSTRSEWLVLEPNPSNDQAILSLQTPSTLHVKRLGLGRGFKREVMDDPNYDALKTRLKMEELDEAKRLLYVAMTRARHVFIAHLAPSSSKAKQKKSSTHSLNEEIDLKDAKGFNDWLRLLK